MIEQQKNGKKITKGKDNAMKKIIESKENRDIDPQLYKRVLLNPDVARMPQDEKTKLNRMFKESSSYDVIMTKLYEKMEVIRAEIENINYRDQEKQERKEQRKTTREDDNSYTQTENQYDPKKAKIERNERDIDEFNDKMDRAINMKNLRGTDIHIIMSLYNSCDEMMFQKMRDLYVIGTDSYEYEKSLTRFNPDQMLEQYGAVYEKFMKQFNKLDGTDRARLMEQYGIEKVPTVNDLKASFNKKIANEMVDCEIGKRTNDYGSLLRLTKYMDESEIASVYGRTITKIEERNKRESFRTDEENEQRAEQTKKLDTELQDSYTRLIKDRGSKDTRETICKNVLRREPRKSFDEIDKTVENKGKDLTPKDIAKANTQLTKSERKGGIIGFFRRLLGREDRTVEEETNEMEQGD